MASFKDLLSRTPEREPIGYVPIVINENDRGQFEPIPKDAAFLGIDPENFVVLGGTGFILFDCPIYAMSSSQKRDWDFGSQRISAAIMGEADDEAVALMLSGGEESDLSTRSQMGLFAVGVENAPMIRAIQQDMVRSALSLSMDQLELLLSVRGLGGPGDDLFSIILEGLRSAFSPQTVKTPGSPNGSGDDDTEGKGKGKAKGRSLPPSA
jgi:hypothetical protein